MFLALAAKTTQISVCISYAYKGADQDRMYVLGLTIVWNSTLGTNANSADQY